MGKKIAIIIACLLVIFLLFLARGLKKGEAEIASQDNAVQEAVNK